MKKFGFILSAFVLGSAVHADTGLQDQDVIRASMAFTTTELAQDSGGVTFQLNGSNKKFPPSVLSLHIKDFGEWDYSATIKQFDAKAVRKTDLVSLSSNKTFARSEAFIGEISGKELNDAYAKAVAECSACQTFVVEVTQDLGWGSFDILPIKNYKGIHAMNGNPSFDDLSDAHGEVVAWSVVHSQIDYLKK